MMKCRYDKFEIQKDDSLVIIFLLLLTTSLQTHNAENLKITGQLNGLYILCAIRAKFPLRLIHVALTHLRFDIRN